PRVSPSDTKGYLKMLILLELFSSFMLEPYAVKVARTVLRGGKREISYLSQLDTLVVHTLNDGGYRLGPFLRAWPFLAPSHDPAVGRPTGGPCRRHGGNLNKTKTKAG